MNIAKLPGNRYIEFLLFFFFSFSEVRGKAKNGATSCLVFLNFESAMERNIGKQRDCRGRCSDCNWFPTRVEQRTFGLFERPHHFITPPTFYFLLLFSLSLFPSLLFFSLPFYFSVWFRFFFLNVIHSPSPQPAKQNNKTKRFRQIFFFCVYKFSPSSFRWRSIRLYNEK